jgi:hypothetical protein
VPGARTVATLARGALFVCASLGALVGGGITLIAATVGVCAAGGLVLYEVARLFAYAFSVSFRWGLVCVCGLLLVGLPLGALIHDVRMIRRLTSPEVSPTRDPQAS